MKRAEDDINSRSFTNLVSMVTHQPALEMNDITPFNDVGNYGAPPAFAGDQDHKGFDTYKITLSKAFKIDDTNGVVTNLERLNDSIKALNKLDDVDGANTRALQRAFTDNTKLERARAMKPFISFDEKADKNVTGAYVTINIDETSSDRDADVVILNAMFAESSLVKLEAMENVSFSAANRRDGMGLPAPNKVAGVPVYGADITIDDNDVNKYMKLWYNCISQQLVLLNAPALSNNYNISSGTLQTFDAGQVNNNDVKVTGWNIMTVNNKTDAKIATTLFDDLEFSNSSAWEVLFGQHGNDDAFQLTTKTINDGADADNDRVGNGGERVFDGNHVPYPDTYVWHSSSNGDNSNSTNWVWVDEFGGVSKPALKNDCVTNGKNLHRYMVAWTSDSFPTEAGVLPAAFRISVDDTFNGNMKVTLQNSSGVNVTGPVGTPVTYSFDNIRDRKFPSANYDKLDEANSVPFVQARVNLPPNVLGADASTKPLYWLSMSRNHQFGQIINDASTQIYDDLGKIKDTITEMAKGLDAGQNLVPKVKVAGLDAGDALDKFNGASVVDQKSNAVFFYRANVSNVVFNLRSDIFVSGNLTGDVNLQKAGFILAVEKNIASDRSVYDLPTKSYDSGSNVRLHSGGLQHRTAHVESFTLDATDAWLSNNHTVLLDEHSKGGSIANILDEVEDHPYRYARDPTATMFKITVLNSDETEVSVWLFPVVYGAATSKISTDSWNTPVTFQNPKLLSTSPPSNTMLVINDNAQAQFMNATTVADYLLNAAVGGKRSAGPSTATGAAGAVGGLFALIGQNTFVDNDASDLVTNVASVSVNHLVGSGSGQQTYAMFLNQYVANDVDDKKNLWASYLVDPTTDNNITIYDRSSVDTDASGNKSIDMDSSQDPTQSIYFIESMNPAPTSDVFTFTNGSNTMKVKQYDIDDKTYKGAVTVNILEAPLESGAPAGVSDTLGTWKTNIGDEFDDASDIVRDLSSHGISSGDKTGPTTYQKLLYIYDNLGLGAADATLYHNALTIWHIGDNESGSTISLRDGMAQPDNGENNIDDNDGTKSAFPRANSVTGQLLSNYDPVSDDQTFSDAIDETGKIFNNELDDFAFMVNQFTLNMKTKVNTLRDALVKGVNSDDVGAFDFADDQLGYLWLQEKLTDFLTVMEETTKAQMKSWVTLAEEGNDGESLKAVVNQFAQHIDNMVGGFMTQYDIILKTIHNEYLEYQRLLGQHHDNIIFHTALAKGMENIAEANIAHGAGASAPSVIFTTGAVNTIPANSMSFYNSSSKDAWEDDSNKLGTLAASDQPRIRFKSAPKSITMSYSEITTEDDIFYADNFELLEPTEGSFSTMVTDMGVSVTDVKVADTEDGLVAASAVGSDDTNTFKYLQITTSPEANKFNVYQLRAVRPSYVPRSLYKVTVTDAVISVDDEASVTINSIDCKVLGGVARAASFVVEAPASATDLTGGTVSAVSSPILVNASSSVDITTPSGTASYTVAKYTIDLHPVGTNNFAHNSGNDESQFNDMGSQYLASCFDSYSTTLKNRKWDTSNIVFDATGRYATIVQNSSDLLGAAEEPTAINYEPPANTYVAKSVMNNYDVDHSGPGVYVDGDGGDNSTDDRVATAYNGGDSTWSRYTADGKMAFSAPEAQTFNAMSVSGNVIAIHVVTTASVNIGYTKDDNTVVSPAAGTVSTAGNVYSLSSLSLDASKLASIQVTGAAAAYAILVEVEHNSVHTIYTLLNNVGVGDGNMSGTVAGQNLYQLFSTSDTSVSMSTDINLPTAYVIPRLSATLNMDDSNNTFANILSLNPGSGANAVADAKKIVQGLLSQILASSDRSDYVD